MTVLSDAAVNRLRDVMERPALPPRYQPVEVIGRGGMGVVWRARDSLLDRDVAVKVVAAHLFEGEFTLRLTREARILARLEHPGIVAVHDCGVLEDGRGWYVMRLVRGTRLDEAARSIATRAELLRVLERLCDTIAYAHAHGVLHRDLKPGNVMLGPFGEILVLDWGVASDRAEDSSSARRGPGNVGTTNAPATTGAGTVLGTPGYMAPEQAAGGAADERSDVHGLGAILRDLCEVHDERVPRALAAIRDRALAADPAGRYRSVTALKDDIRLYLDGQPVSAHRENLLERATRFASTYQTPILLVLAYLVMRVAILLWRGV